MTTYTVNLQASSASNSIQIIPDRLYWLSDEKPPQNIQRAMYFSIDDQYQYVPFNYDFGPLHLGQICRFAKELNDLLKNPKYSTYKLIHYTSIDLEQRSNAALLMCCFQILFLNRTSSEAWSYFENKKPLFKPYRDSLPKKVSTFDCYIIDCLLGLEKANQLGWFDVNTFNITAYEHFSLKGNGDLNIIIPEQFVAFAAPLDKRPENAIGQVFTTKDFIPFFKELGVDLVLRLNGKVYDETPFEESGIKVLDLYFNDGSTPPDDIVESFFEACDSTTGRIAVHCKAGLGRTGTLIALYAMKFYGFNAREIIGWIRICRPGSIHGPQHQYICDQEVEYTSMKKSITSSLMDMDAYQLQKLDFGGTMENYQDQKTQMVPSNYSSGFRTNSVTKQRKELKEVNDKNNNSFFNYTHSTNNHVKTGKNF